jgi:hypothetical protein
MSTKTSIKRIAAVAAVALTFGGLTAVSAQASAGANITALTAGTPAPARVGVSSGTTVISPTLVSSPSGNDTITAQIVSAPATSVNAVIKIEAASTASATIVSSADSSKTDQLTAANAGVANAVITAGTSTKAFRVSVNPDVAGTYQVLVTANPSTLAGYSTGAVSTSFTITTAGAPTALTLASYAGSATNKDEATGGQLFKLTMKDANGVATVLGLNEAIKVSAADSSLTVVAGESGSATSFGSAAKASGSYYVRVTGYSSSFAAGTSVLSATGSGLVSSSVTTNATITLTEVSYFTGGVVTCTTADNCVAGTDFDVAGSVALSITAASAALTAATNYVTLTTDAAGKTYSGVASAAIGKTSASFTSPAVNATTTSATVKPLTAAGTGTSYVFDYVVPAAGTIAVQGAASVLSATGAKNTFTVLVTDQYKTKIQYAAVTVSVAGRNTVATTALGVTDANGLISYSFTDAGTTGSSDTFTFTASGVATAATAKVTYGTVTVDSVTVSGGSKAETVAGSTLTAINGADNGPETSAVPVKAVVKDASGNLLAGVAVTFTVDKGAIKKTAAIDYATVYTGSDGSATTYAFNWVPGTQTITATAGGKSSTDYLTWAATDATTARVLSATATGDIVTVKVVDRFGNGVKGVTVNLARTGTGLFGNGASTQDVTTDKNGTADVRFSGNGTVEASLNTTTYAQAGDKAAEIAATAVTAAVAGTTKGTGASLAPAGVNKVTVAVAEGDNATLAAAQSASDAAAEATDAANAATDAANAAAEAADAATAAAQDAADAVAALSTQVTEMVSALKKQITALTNLVIKIQKKVKA